MLVLESIHKTYPSARQAALVDVSLSFAPGTTAAIVGASGSGKSTLARIAVGLEPPTSGRARFEGRDLARLDARARKALRRRVQIVLQDPGAALDPRLSVGAAVEEALQIHGLEAGPRRVEGLFTEVGLDPALSRSRPHALSGGEKQRAALARALAVGPELIILDEPLSQLDWVTAAGILGILEALAVQGRTIVLVSHDLAAVRALVARVIVLERGRVVEDRPTDALFRAPAHPHTRALIDAAQAWSLPAP